MKNRMPRSEIPTNKILQSELAMANRYPFYLLDSGYLYIKTKEAELIPFKPNRAQRYLNKLIMECRAKKIPCRLWVLKARQEGISTDIQGLIYSLTSQKDNVNSLVMGDEKDKSEYLFQMSKLYHEQLTQKEPHLAPTLKKSNSKVLEFEGMHSQIIIETAENVDATRAFTYQYVHLSEVSRFRDLEGVLGGLMQSVPDHWDTIVIGETTANGMEAFWREWMRSIRGETAWTPVFIPWFWMETYVLPLEKTGGAYYSIKGIIWEGDQSERKFIEEEKEIAKEHKLGNEQLNWRRWAIVNKCQGSVNTFKQEYPCTWEEAFIMSGELFFDKEGMKRQKGRDPISKGEVFNQDDTWTFRELPYGKVYLYEKPNREEEYIVAEDASEGIPGKDEGAIVVLNKRLNTVAATVHGPIPPEDLADIGIGLAHYFNEALIVPENKGYGYVLCQRTYKSYGNIYRRMINKTGENKPTDELGFYTGSVTRSPMLAQMNEEIRLRSTSLVCRALIEQTMTFIVNPDTKKAEAARGAKDDLVLARAIAGIVRMERPYVSQREIEDEKPMEELHKGSYGFTRRPKGGKR